MAVETAKKQGSIKPRRMKAPKPFKKRIEPWLWLMPALVFFLVFTYYPFIKTVVSSFFVVNKMGVFKQFAGFDNYVRVLKDRSFQTAIQNTFIYVLLASPVSILIALCWRWSRRKSAPCPWRMRHCLPSRWRCPCPSAR